MLYLSQLCSKTAASTAAITHGWKKVSAKKSLVRLALNSGNVRNLCFFLTNPHKQCRTVDSSSVRLLSVLQSCSQEVKTGPNGCAAASNGVACQTRGPYTDTLFPFFLLKTTTNVGNKQATTTRDFWLSWVALMLFLSAHSNHGVIFVFSFAW